MITKRKFKRLEWLKKLNVVVLIAMSATFAFSAVSSLVTNNEYFHLKRMALIILGVAVFILTSALYILDKFLDKKLAEESYATNNINIQVNSLVFQHSVTLLDSSEFHALVTKHCKQIEDYFNSLINRIDKQIESVVNIETLEQFDDIKSGLNKQEILMHSILNQLVNIQNIEDFIAGVHRSCLDEIKKQLIDWIKENKELKYLFSFKPFDSNSKFDKKKFRLDVDDIYFDIDYVRSKFERLTIRKMQIEEGKRASLTSVAILMGLNADDITDFIQDQILNSDITETIMHSFLDVIGATIPFLGPAFLIFRIGRFLYRNRDRSEEIELLKKNTSESIKKYMAELARRSVSQINDDSTMYVKELIKKLKENFNRAEYYSKKAASYL